MNTKNIVKIALVSLLAIVLIVLLGRYAAGIFHRDNPALIQERQVIGTVSSYNPRVMEIQQTLQTSGFNPGNVDGIMQPQTREAIKAFQQTKLLPATGAIDDATMLELNRAKEMIDNPDETVEAGSAAPQASQTPDTAQLPTQNSEKGIAVTLEEEQAAKQSEPAAKAVPAVKQDRIHQIQAALKKAGFYNGPVDGKIGKKTKQAVIAFQKAHKLKADGVVGQKTWNALRKYGTN